MRHWREAARRLKKAGAAAQRVAAAREKLLQTETFSVWMKKLALERLRQAKCRARAQSSARGERYRQQAPVLAQWLGPAEKHRALLQPCCE